MQDLLELIVSQQRELNAAFAEFRERMASVETKVTILVGGDGQPGLFTGVLDDVKDLQRWRWRLVGIATGVATMVSGVVTGVALLLKG
jgi:hypothetical protein